MKLWGSLLLVSILLLALVGCGSGQAPAASATPTETSEDTKDKEGFPVPDFSQPSPLHLIAMTDNASRLYVSVGDQADVFRAAFPRNPNISRSLDGMPPAGADLEKWDSIGWALDSASRGVGALLYDKRVALAMSQLENVEESHVSREVGAYQVEFGQPMQGIGGKHVRYWFWQRGTVLLMICAFQNSQGEMDLTTAVGDAGVMGHLRMSPGSARDDLRTVEKLYSPVGSASKAVTESK